MSKPVTTRHAVAADLPAISALHQLVFGPGRFARSAYRVREGTGKVSRLCRVAERASGLVAALRMTEVAIGGVEGAVLLGPLAVNPEYRGQGYGRQLVAEALAEAKALGLSLVVLVGDVPYYGRFGFAPVPPGQIALPGPVNPARLLAVELQNGALKRYCGAVTAAVADGKGGKS